MPAPLTAPISWGDLIDRITILEIKTERIADAEKTANVARELAALAAVRDQGPEMTDEMRAATAALKSVNEALWDIEDNIREHEARQDFGQGFIDLARSVYITNDRRAALKKQVNRLMGSELVEEKSYADYGAGVPE